MQSTRCFIELEPFTDKSFSDRNNRKILREHIREYIGRNIEILSAPSLEEKPSFSMNEDQEIMFTSMGVTRIQIADILNRTNNKDVHAGWKVWSSEQYLAFTMTIRYFTRAKDKEMMDLCGLYFAIMIYSFLHRKYFKHGAKKEVMDYTIGTLSNKYDIKKYGSLIEVLKKIADGNLENAKSRLLKTEDIDIFVYPRDFRTRMNTFIQNISNEYYKNYEEGNYLNIEKDEMENEEGESFKIDRLSDSSAIYSAADSFEIWFMTNRLNETLIRSISSMTPEISPSKLSSTLNAVKYDKKGRLRIIIRSLVGSLLENQKDNSLRAIHSKAFPIFCIKILSMSNTKNDNIVTLKRNTDSLLNDYCDTFRKTKREASKINYRKAIILYFAMGLQMQRK
jgi:hypothetical protein